MKHMGRKFGSALVAGLIGLSLAGPAQAIVIGNADTVDADYIALAGTYTSVGQIQGFDAAGEFAASGVLIQSAGSLWGLTAAHVTSGASSIKFFLDGGGGFSTFDTRTGILADQVYTNPNWTGSLSGGYDIGLFHLGAAESCIGSGACVAANFGSSSAKLGTAVTEVGYGMTGTGKTGATTFDGKKRAGTNTFDAYYNNGLKNILLADFDSGSRGDNKTGSAKPTSMEAMIGPGDSGGGLFDSAGMLIGITSFIWGLDGKANSDFGDVGGWTSIASSYSWITSCITNGTGCGANSIPAATSRLLGGDMEATRVVPEPPGITVIGFGLAALFLLRRRGTLRRERRFS